MAGIALAGCHEGFECFGCRCCFFCQRNGLGQCGNGCVQAFFRGLGIIPLGDGCIYDGCNAFGAVLRVCLSLLYLFLQCGLQLFYAGSSQVLQFEVLERHPIEIGIGHFYTESQYAVCSYRAFHYICTVNTVSTRLSVASIRATFVGIKCGSGWGISSGFVQYTNQAAYFVNTRYQMADCMADSGVCSLVFFSYVVFDERSRHAASVIFTFCRPSVDLECISSFDIPTTEGIIVGSGNQPAHIHGGIFAHVLYFIEAQVVPSDVRTSAVFHVLYEGNGYGGRFCHGEHRA